MLDIEQSISPLVESLFPEFYRTEGENFVEFVKTYYKWLETNFQRLEVKTIEGFSVGDTITQWQNPDTTAVGKIYAIEDTSFLVQLETFDPFRCELNCNILTDVTNQDGNITHILYQNRINPIYGARNLFKFRDVDTTIDSLILHFKEKYLKNIQFNLATNKQLLIKNSLDLYRSKGTERSIDLFFKLVYNKNAEVYYPGDDIFRLSDGDWYIPQYLEITNSDRAADFVGKTVYGMSSGASAFVERFIKRRIATGYIYLLFISNIVGDFKRGEALKTDQVYPDAPKILGSLDSLDVITSGSGYAVGDIVNVIDEYGQFGKARVTGVETNTGQVEFIFIDGGYGYSTTPVKYLSDKILTISGLTSSNTSYFIPFDQISQKSANLIFSSLESNSISSNDSIFSYHGNGSVKAEGLVLGANLAPIISLSIDTSNGNDILTLASGNTEDIVVGDLIIGSTNTAVVNTDSSARVTAIVNSTALEVNAAIAISNGTASVASSPIGEVGQVYVYIVDGEFGEERVYTTGNSITGQVETVNDKSVYAKIIKVPDEYTLAVENSSGIFDIGDQVYQLNGPTEVANGTVLSVSVSSGSGSLEVTDIAGVWDTTEPILSRSSSGQANLVAVSTTIPIQYDREKNVEVIVDTSANSTTLLTFSSGNTSGMNPGDQLTYSSNIAVINHNVGAFVEQVVNSTAVVMDAPVIVANGIASLVFLDITDNDLIADPLTPVTTPYGSFIIDSISLGQGAEYSIVNVATSETVFLNTDLISGINTSNVPFLSVGLTTPSFGFPKDPTANLSSYIVEALDFKLMEIGSITDVITSNPGNDYTLPPQAVIIEPTIAAMRLKDYVLEIQETPGAIKNGDTITQIVGNTTFTIVEVANVLPFITGEIVYQGPSLGTSTANGVVYTANIFNSSLYLTGAEGTFNTTDDLKSYITPAEEEVFSITVGTQTDEIAKGIVRQTIPSSNSTLVYVTRKSVPSFQVSGPQITSGAAFANVISVGEDVASTQIGLNAEIEANVIISEGSVSNLEVIDSGFGYPNNAIATFEGTAGQAPGLARLSIDNYGKGQGYYRDSRGFVSDDKKLFDGIYYQEYSYEILSSFSIDKYIEIFRNVMHVAGTQVFGSVVLQDRGELRLDSNENIITTDSV